MWQSLPVSSNQGKVMEQIMGRKGNANNVRLQSISRNCMVLYKVECGLPEITNDKFGLDNQKIPIIELNSFPRKNTIVTSL